MGYIGALDQGTSSTRFIIFNQSGQIVGQDQLEHSQILPQAGWVEHDGAEIWRAGISVITGALKKAGIKGSDLNSIGITNQRETALIWDKSTGLPLHNAIVWQDTRTADFLNALSDEVKEKIVYKTGLAIAPYFSASKINWLIKNVSAVALAIKDGRALAGTIDSWLLWNLTGGVNGGVHYTDVTNASRTLLMNLESLDWDSELLEIFEIPRQILAEIKSSSQVYGHSHSDGPLASQVPISGILGDQQAAMVGQTCFELGESKTTYGTGNFALLNTGTQIVRSKHGLLTTLCYKFGDDKARYALEGSVAVTGSAVQWLRDQLGIITSAPQVEELAKSVSDNGGVYFVPAFSGLFAPYWRSDARGAIVGLSRAATKAHLARACLEAICYQTRDVLDAMCADSRVALTEIRVDGGITANQLCMQMQADVMGVEVIRPVIIETTALGAAYAAGLATGFYKDTNELKAKWREDKRFKPDKASALATTGFKNWKKAIEKTLNWLD